MANPKVLVQVLYSSFLPHNATTPVPQSTAGPPSLALPRTNPPPRKRLRHHPVHQRLTLRRHRQHGTRFAEAMGG